MLTRAIVCLAIGLLMFGSRVAHAGSSPCDAVIQHRGDTVIVFAPPSSFTICRGGSEEADVVTGRRTYLQLLAVPGAAMFRFRVHGQEVEPKATGLSDLAKSTRAATTSLGELAHSSQAIASLSLAGETTPLGVARARYLGVVTPTFSEAAARSRADLPVLLEAARITHRWCGELKRVEPPPDELHQRCGSSESIETDVTREVTTLEAAEAGFETARDRAREAAIDAAARTDDAHAQSEAVAALDRAREAANAVIGAAARLAEAAKELSGDLPALRAAIGALGALRPGVPTYLTTYGQTGNAVLRIDVIPAGIGEDFRDPEQSNVSFRFPVVGRHYFDVELGAGVTGGMPLIPVVSASGGASVIDGKSVDQFVALALVELEPLRFAWPDKPIAGLLRFPVIGIPLSRDPTQNFFVGGGIGWTGIGSITAGPYLLRELTLLPGHSIGDTLPTGTSLDAVTSPQVNLGFFVSASIDLVGLFHLFVPERVSTLDAATGREN